MAGNELRNFLLLSSRRIQRDVGSPLAKLGPMIRHIAERNFLISPALPLESSQPWSAMRIVLSLFTGRLGWVRLQVLTWL